MMDDDWIKVRAGLPRNPRVLMMSALVGQDRWGIVGRLSDIWAWIGAHSPDGSGVQLSRDLIDKMIECPGFASAMERAGWLSGDDWALVFPEWDRHNSRCAKARAMEREARRLRRADHIQTDCQAVVGDLSDKCPTGVGKVSGDCRGNVGPETRAREKRARGEREREREFPTHTNSDSDSEWPSDAPIRVSGTPEQQIAAAHSEFCRLTGQDVPMRPDRERAWFEWLRSGYDLPDLRLVVGHILRGIRNREDGVSSSNLRNRGALKFSNLIGQLDRFDEEVAAARGANGHGPDPDGPRVLTREQEEDVRRRMAERVAAYDARFAPGKPDA